MFKAPFMGGARLRKSRFGKTRQWKLARRVISIAVSILQQLDRRTLQYPATVNDSDNEQAGS